MEKSGTRRIARNSFLLLVRMLVLMLINLYAVRVLLRQLGVEDYGVYQVVAGVVTTMTCLSSVFAISCQRFYSYATGKGETEKLPQIFSASVNINLCFCFVLLLVFETVGLWFLTTQSSIPPLRMQAALYCFQAAMLTFLLSLMQIPFTAAIIAHEDMGYYTLVSTIECLLKLVAALMVGRIALDGLLTYGAGLTLVALLVFGTYAMIGRRHYPECHYERVNDRSLYRQMLSFSGWTLFGSVANVGMFQGNTLLLSSFFNPLINAAFGISLHLNAAFNSLCATVVLAIRPVMTRSYADGNHTYLMQMFSVSNKVILYTLMALGIPLILEMPFVLTLWLGEIDANMVIFSRCVICFVIIMTLHHPITIVMQAAGKVKTYHLFSETVMLLCVPLSYGLFKAGFPPYATSVSMIAVCVLAHLVRMGCMHHYFPQFSLMRYSLTLLLPGSCIGLGVYAGGTFLQRYLCGGWTELLLMLAVVPSAVLLLSYLVGISSAERQIVNSFIAQQLRKIKK